MCLAGTGCENSGAYTSVQQDMMLCLTGAMPAIQMQQCKKSKVAHVQYCLQRMLAQTALGPAGESPYRLHSANHRLSIRQVIYKHMMPVSPGL